jgi:transmembrane sensor
MSSPTPLPEELEELAARWAVRHAEGLEPPARIELERWLKADPRHYAVFAEAELALSLLRPAGDARERDALRQEIARCEDELRHRLRRSRVALAAAGLAAAAALWIALSPLAWHWSATPAAASATPTVAVRPLVQLLPDGTAVELNTGADLAVEFTPQVRGVRLLRGEAHFAVAKDHARPFVVAVGAVAIRAVGTAFNVRVEPAAVQVLVTEGRVAVEAPRADDDPTGAAAPGAGAGPPAAAGSAGPAATIPVAVGFVPDPAPPAPRATRGPLLLAAGHRTVVALGSPAAPVPVAAPVSPDEIRRELAWRRMRLELSNATLEEAVALYNRHGRVQFAVGDAELRTRRLSGIFRADQPAQFAELIEAALNLRVLPDGPDRIVLRQP